NHQLSSVFKEQYQYLRGLQTAFFRGDYLVDHDEDILIGDILPDGSIELIIINDGDENQHSRIGLVEIERAK
ncbi:MAG: hypothetical protein JXB42_03225, partial [Deltaproteobacteria bacterium]|nr:hypothetical protein [Deltaproteobacteria bacterium]